VDDQALVRYLNNVAEGLARFTTPTCLNMAGVLRCAVACIVAGPEVSTRFFAMVEDFNNLLADAVARKLEQQRGEAASDQQNGSAP
jgi:hypothetical protein